MKVYFWPAPSFLVSALASCRKKCIRPRTTRLCVVQISLVYDNFASPLGEKTRPAILFGKKPSRTKIGNTSRHTFSEGFFGRLLEIGNKSGHTFPVAFLDDFQEFGRFSAIFIFYFRLSIPGNGAENGCFSYVDFVSFCQIRRPPTKSTKAYISKQISSCAG